MKDGCKLCPRACGVDRAAGELGFCGMGSVARVARASLHPFEEPSISGTRGSGTVFFAGCSLGCVYCQNAAIRTPESGTPLEDGALAALFLAVQAAGAHNLNLVTATHFADRVASALALARPALRIPVVYNCGGYERVETLRLLEGLVDVYLPDFKYVSSSLAAACSAAPDYVQHACAALGEMFRQVGAVRFDGEGMMQSGVMVRHLVLPGYRADSMAVLDAIAETLPVQEIRLSLMRQYTPEFAGERAPRSLHRRVTSFEYEAVMAHAEALGFEGYYQGKESATAAFTPDFAERELLADFLHNSAREEKHS